MKLRFEQWSSFLAVDHDTIATLQGFADVVVPHIDSIMDAVYAHIASSPQASAVFASPEIMQHARQRQQRHWLDYVFVGNFDDKYVKNTKAIGLAHYRIGVDQMFYMGAYSVVMNEIIRLVNNHSFAYPDDATRYLSAINSAIYLDMGLATSVYYNSVVETVEELAHELNLSLARAGEYRDNETGKHILRMSRMCYVLARALGKSHKWAKTLEVASPLHDVGKIGIPDDILLKPGRLSAEEITIMRQHPQIGGEIIPEHSAAVIQMAKRISLTHHEKWDGTGYPTGLAGEEIPLEGRIASICDVYDALMSERPYKQPWTRVQAVEYLESNSGKHFDPKLVETFLLILPQIDAIQAEYAE